MWRLRPSSSTISSHALRVPVRSTAADFARSGPSPGAPGTSAPATSASSSASPGIVSTCTW